MISAFPFLLAIAFIQSTAYSKARIGFDDGMSEDTPEFVCRLTMKDSDGNASFCSGTLISNDRISTAGHCTGKKIEKVECGYHINAKNQAEFRVSIDGADLSVEKDQNDSKKSKELLAFQDFGVLHLKKPVRGIDPLRAPSSKQELLNTFFEEASMQSAIMTSQSHGMIWKDAVKKYKFYSIKDGIDCKVSGFGNSFNNGKILKEMKDHHEEDYNKLKNAYKTDSKNLNKEHDHPVTASMKITKIPMNEFVAVTNAAGELNSYQHTEFLRTGSINRTTIEEGDSGGPLYCRLKSTDPYTLIGINQSIWNGNGGTSGLNYGGNVFSFLPDDILAKVQPPAKTVIQSTNAVDSPSDANIAR